jgi:hypothetical protein
MKFKLFCVMIFVAGMVIGALLMAVFNYINEINNSM